MQALCRKLSTRSENEYEPCEKGTRLDYVQRKTGEENGKTTEGGRLFCQGMPCSHEKTGLQRLATDLVRLGVGQVVATHRLPAGNSLRSESQNKGVNARKINLRESRDIYLTPSRDSRKLPLSQSWQAQQTTPIGPALIATQS